MGKKGGNTGPGNQNQNAKPKPTPIPNKEIIQRMNFLHQAATLISGALLTPLPPRASTSKLSDNTAAAAAAAAAAEEQKKREKTSHKANKLAASGQLIGTQTTPWYYDGGGPSSSEDSDSSHNCDCESCCIAYNKPFSSHKASADQSKQQKASLQEARYLDYLKDKGLTSAQIQVKLNQRKRRFLRKNAKANMSPLQVGSASYINTAEGDTSNKRGMQEKPQHPSQVQHRSLAAHYVNDIRTMARKSVLRIDPSVKRTMCRNCNALLIPGLTSSVKILPSKSHVHLIRTKCLACKVTRSVPSPPLHLQAGEEESATIPSVESSMQEDSTTPTSVDPSTSRTLSEDSAGAEEASMTVDDSTAGESPKEDEAAQATVKAGPEHAPKRGKKQKQFQYQRKKRNADPIVPGTKKQYTHPRFHERPENVVIQVNNMA